MFEAIWLYVLFAFLIVAPVVYNIFFKRKLQAKAAQLGTDAGLNLEEKVKASNASRLQRVASDLGRRVTFEDATAGRQVVDAVLGSAKAATSAGTDSWNLKFAAADDVSLAWTVDAGTGVLAVNRAREMMSEPVGDRAWGKLVTALTAAASERGVPAEIVTVPLVPMSPQNDKEPWWVAG